MRLLRNKQKPITPPMNAHKTPKMRTTMNHQNEFLLPDKSFWQALNRRQREALSSKYTILCPPILLAEIARHKENKFNALLNLENIFTVPSWSRRAKIELLTGKSSEPIPFICDTATQSIFDSSEQELSALKESADKCIQALIDNEKNIKNRVSIIDPWKEKLLSLVKNTD